MENLPTNGPAFCIKICEGDLLRKLLVPPTFIEKHGAILPQTVTLKPDYEYGKSCDVKIESEDGCYWLTHGWRQFVEENNINFPDFLVFRFVEPSKILVKIFGKNQCKRNAAPIHTSEQVSSFAETNGEESSINEDRPETSKENVKMSFIWQENMTNRMSMKGSVCKQMDIGKQSEVKVKNIKGDEYKVKLFKSKDGRVGFGKGWASFVKSCNFVVNKHYLFEFLPTRNGHLLLLLKA